MQALEVCKDAFDKRINLQILNDDLLKMLHTALEDNTFTFNNDNYLQMHTLTLLQETESDGKVNIQSRNLLDPVCE